MKKEKEIEPKGFDVEFRKLIKSIMLEEGVVTKEDLKKYAENTVCVMEPFIASIIKKHLAELSKAMLNTFSEELTSKKIGEQ